MPRIITWDKETAKVELSTRLQQAMEARTDIEREWKQNERAILTTRGGMEPDVNIAFNSAIEADVTDIDSSNMNIGTNYVFKNLRLMHSQLSANPPVVVPRPTSNDPADRRKADAADRLIHYGRRQYNIAEKVDNATLQMLYYGSVISKTIWDPEKGEIFEINEQTGDMLMEGDIAISTPSIWNVYPDPDPEVWEEVRYVFERVVIPYEEAIYRFPEYEELLKKIKIERDYNRDNSFSRTSYITGKKFDVVELYEYWETGLPHNGMIGRFCYCTKEGDVLGELKPNPFRFTSPKHRGLSIEQTDKPQPELPGKAKLPYHLLTDIDVPKTYWGRATVTYEAPLQDALNRIDNVTLDILQAHGIVRMILPEGAEIADDSITNSSWDIVKTTGNRDPKFMDPMPFPQSLPQTRDRMKQGVDDMAGVNESMFGQQSREQSGLSMQYATNQGNMIRWRLFNKYRSFVESIYRAYLNLVRKHWVEKRLIYVLGKEKAFEALDIKGADIDGGYDLVVEHGTSLSLDPITRREEILTLMPLFEKAGVETRTILSMLKLNELEGLYDRVQLASDRQREYFEEMIASQIYLAPQELEDHKYMLAFAYEFVMTTEFKYLPDSDKALIRQHIKQREQLAQPSAGVAAPGPAPELGGMPPIAPGMAGPATTEQLLPPG